MSKYPRLGQSENRKRNTSARCIVCGEVASKRVEIQINEMRGDDEQVWSCGNRKHTGEQIIEAYQRWAIEQHKKARLYAERDIEAQGDFYSRHVSAMTAEDLNRKSDIAAELAHRDMRIAELGAETQDQKDVIDMLAQSKAEIQAEQLILVRAMMAGCKDIPALDERITDEIERLRGEGL